MVVHVENNMINKKALDEFIEHNFGGNNEPKMMYASIDATKKIFPTDKYTWEEEYKNGVKVITITSKETENEFYLTEHQDFEDDYER